MSEWIETELKLAIPDERAWEWVRAQLGPGRIVRQANHFFDRRDRALSGDRIAVRLRAAASARILTVKGSAGESAGQAVTRRFELESPVPSGEFDRALHDGLSLANWIENWRAIVPQEASDREDLARFLDRLERLTSDAPLERYAGFSNRRETLPFEALDAVGRLDLELELDRTEFPGGRIAFEIEVERTSERDEAMTRTRRALTAWLEKEGGIRPFTAESKLTRLNALVHESEKSRKARADSDL
ncbi:MAG: hypothetical protein CL933_24240 [Deltaproteobacteria bacterium]|nr:hypothetical protein [Deltaproteobacteria bacterium]